MSGQHRDDLPPAAVAGLAVFVVLVVVVVAAGFLLAVTEGLAWVMGW